MTTHQKLTSLNRGSALSSNGKKLRVTLILIVAFSTAIAFYASKHFHVFDTPIEKLLAQSPADIQPEGELSELFAPGSESTEMQRSKKFDEIQGKIVQWKLEVWDVKKSGENYIVETNPQIPMHFMGQVMQPLLGTVIHIIPQSEGDRNLLRLMKKGDSITFKGIVSGLTPIASAPIKELEINPAVIVAAESKNAPSAQKAISQEQQSPKLVQPTGQSPDQAIPVTTKQLQQQDSTLVGNYVELKKIQIVSIGTREKFPGEGHFGAITLGEPTPEYPVKFSFDESLQKQNPIGAYKVGDVVDITGFADQANGMIDVTITSIQRK